MTLAHPIEPADAPSARAELVERLMALPKTQLAQALASLPAATIEQALEGGEAMGDDLARAQEYAHVQRAERRRTFQAAKAVFNNRMSVADCTIRNRSDRGFLVETKNSLSMPEGFELRLEMTDERFPVRVIWRNGGQLGVAIDD